MIKSSLAALALLVTLGTGAAYADGSATRIVTGPNGNTGTVDMVWSCQNGVCSWQKVATGPNGGTALQSGTATRPAPGVVTVNRSTTGPYGRTIDRSTTIVRN